MTDIDPGAAQPTPPPWSTLDMSLQENLISKDDGSDDAPLRWLKFSTTFSLYLICSRDSTILVHMRKRHSNKRWYVLPYFMIWHLNERFSITFSSKNVTRDGRSKTLLSLVDTSITTISIVLALTLQEVGSFTFTVQQYSLHTSHHISGGSDSGPSCPFFPKWATTSYQQKNIHGLARRLQSRLNILFLIQFLFYFFYDTFCWSVHTYGIHCLFDKIFFSLDYSYLYY